MNKLYFIIGISHGGKSTLAKKWLNYENYIVGNKFSDYSHTYDEDSYGFQHRQDHIGYQKRVVVSGDEIRKALYGSLWNQFAEDFVDAVKWVMLSTLLNSGHTVLLDETNTSERNIRKIFEIDPNAEFVYVDTSVEVCKERANETLWKPIDRMYMNLQDLDNKYGDWEEHGPTSLGTLPNLNQLKAIINNLKSQFLEDRETFTNVTTRNTTTKNSALPEVPVTPKPSVSSATCTWTTTIPDVPQYQVW
jgi:predicted kinase